MKTVKIDGVEYVPKSEANSCKAGLLAKPKNKKPYVIVRTYSAGVFAGYLDKREGKEAKVLNARRLWYWDGASSLSQLSQDGVSKPENCKFPCEVPYVELTEVIEVLPCTQKAKDSIASVSIWQK